VPNHLRVLASLSRRSLVEKPSTAFPQGVTCSSSHNGHRILVSGRSVPSPLWAKDMKRMNATSVPAVGSIPPASPFGLDLWISSCRDCWLDSQPPALARAPGQGNAPSWQHHLGTMSSLWLALSFCSLAPQRSITGGFGFRSRLLTSTEFLCAQTWAYGLG